MSKIELPPLPPCEVHRASWDSGWSQYHDTSDPLPEKWDDEPPDEVQGFLSGEQLRARDRQIVELCAALCKSLMPQNDRSDWTEYAQMSADALSRAEDAIRSLLDEKKGNE